MILDDLDRADPRVVPELLLRDLLELPQFSFLMPFDRGVVARTLTEHHKAWRDPDRFLEKIFDYQIALPEPSPSARLRMIEGGDRLVDGPLLRAAAAGVAAASPAGDRRTRTLA